MNKLNNRVILIGMLILFTIISMTNVYAFEFDNVKDYIAENKTITIRDSIIGIPTTKVADITLKTESIEYVIPGPNRKVAEFEINLVDDTYENALKDMKFYDVNKNLIEINRDFVYKAHVKVGAEEVPLYEKVCDLVPVPYATEGKGATAERCFNVEIGKQIVDVYDWIPIEKAVQLTKGTTTIGVFTTVYPGDRIEWIPEIMGVKINEWAVWTDGLSVGLQAYYKMNDTSGGAIDSLGIYNASAAGTLIFQQVGKINGSIYNSRIGQLNTTLTIPAGTAAKSIAGWINVTNNAQGWVWNSGTLGTSGQGFGLISRFSADNDLYVYGQAADFGCTSIITYSRWHHVAVTYNSSMRRLYVDGVNCANSTAAINTGTLPFIMGGYTFAGTNRANVSLDELAVYNRSLTDAEVLQLNESITYSNEVPSVTPNIQIALGYPTNNSNILVDDVTFNWTITPTAINISNYTFNLWYSNGTLVETQFNNTLANAINSTTVFNKTINNLIDSSYYWTASTCGYYNSTYGICNSTTNNTFNLDANFPTVVINSLNNATTGTLPVNVTLNATSSDANLQACYYSYGTIGNTNWNISSNYLSFYQFNETTGTNVIDSNGTRNGTRVNAQMGVAGMSGTAYRFKYENSSYVAAGYTLPTASDVSIAFWIYNYENNGNDGGLWDNYVVATDNGGFDFTIKFNNIEGNAFEYFNAAAAPRINYSLPNEEWTHIAFTMNSTSGALYVNGVYNATGPGGNTGNGANLEIGRNVGGVNYANMTLDEYLLYDRVLTAAEITALYGSYVNSSSNQNFIYTCNTTTNISLNSYGQFNISVYANDSFGRTTQVNRTIYVSDANFPTLTLNTPTQNQSFVALSFPKAISLNFTATDSGLSNCGYTTSDNSTETIITCNTINGVNFLTPGYKTINYFANDTFGNRNSSNVSFFIHRANFSSTAYELDEVNFSLILYNQSASPSPATLVYNGNNQTTTVYNYSTGIFALNSSFAIPQINAATQNNSVRWLWNSESSEYLNQTVTAVNLSVCSIANNVPFINYTFQDELVFTSQNASADLATFTYYLGDVDVNKTYSFSNSSQNPSYSFCFSPASRTVPIQVDAFRYSGTNYPQRIYTNPFANYTNVTTNQTLYMLSSSEGVYSSILVVVGLGTTPIVGAEVVVELLIGSDYEVIAQGSTDSSGIVTFFLNPTSSYRFSVSADGYISQQFNLNPSQTIYTVRMQTTGDTGVAYNSSLLGYKWFVTPQSGSLDPGVNQYNLTLVTTAANLYSCRFSLLDQITLAVLNSTTGGNSTGCELSLYYNNTDNNNLFGRLEINNTLTNGSFQIVDTDWMWILIDRDLNATTTIISFFRDLSDLSDFGGTSNRQEFSKMMFFFLIATILLAVFTFFTGFEIQNPGVAVLILWFVIAIGSIAGFFNFIAASENLNPWIKQYGILIIYSMFAIGFIINQFRRQSQ